MEVARRRPNRVLWPVAALIPLLLILAQTSCTSSSTDTRGGELTGVVWASTSVAGYGPPPPGLRVYATFADGRVRGSDGCNAYGGSYTSTSDGNLDLGAMATTSMACREPVASFSSAYGGDLDRAASYWVDGDSLTLFDSHGKAVLHYASHAPPPIAGLTWRVLGYRDGPAGDKQAMVTPLPGSRMTAAFGADGTLTGSTGCNTYSGHFTISGPRFDLGPLAVTERACIEHKRMRQESAFLSALTSATSWQFSGPAFVLLNSSHTVAVTFGPPGS